MSFPQAVFESGVRTRREEERGWPGARTSSREARPVEMCGREGREGKVIDPGGGAGVEEGLRRRKDMLAW
jgi:hypothetical protein